MHSLVYRFMLAPLHHQAMTNNIRNEVKRNLASDMAVNEKHEQVEEKENEHDARVEDSYNDNPALHRLNESLEMILTKTIEINTITNETISKYDSMHI